MVLLFLVLFLAQFCSSKCRNPKTEYIIYCMCVQVMSDSFATPWTVVQQVSLSMGFSRQEYWSGCHFLLQIFPTQGSNPHLLELLHWQMNSLPLRHPGSLICIATYLEMDKSKETLIKLFQILNSVLVFFLRE